MHLLPSMLILNTAPKNATISSSCLPLTFINTVSAVTGHARPYRDCRASHASPGTLMKNPECQPARRHCTHHCSIIDFPPSLCHIAHPPNFGDQPSGMLPLFLPIFAASLQCTTTRGVIQYATFAATLLPHANTIHHRPLAHDQISTPTQWIADLTICTSSAQPSITFSAVLVIAVPLHPKQACRHAQPDDRLEKPTNDAPFSIHQNSRLHRQRQLLLRTTSACPRSRNRRVASARTVVLRYLAAGSRRWLPVTTSLTSGCCRAPSVSKAVRTLTTTNTPYQTTVGSQARV